MAFKPSIEVYNTPWPPRYPLHLQWLFCFTKLCRKRVNPWRFPVPQDGMMLGFLVLKDRELATAQIHAYIYIYRYRYIICVYIYIHTVIPQI